MRLAFGLNWLTSRGDQPNVKAAAGFQASGATGWRRPSEHLHAAAKEASKTPRTAGPIQRSAASGSVARLALWRPVQPLFRRTAKT